MNLNEEIDKQKQAISKLEKNLALTNLKTRKAQTRRKIEFGGLVVKSGMDAYSKDVILGVLAHAANLIEQDIQNLKLFESIGETSFLDKG